MRLEGWEERLAAYVAEVEARPFSWGTFDCALLVADVISLLVGEDLGEGLRGTYDTASRAIYRLCQVTGSPGFEEAVEALADLHGFCEIEPSLAWRGDVVLVESLEDHLGLGFVHPSGKIMCFVGERLSLLPLERAVRAWRIA